MVAGRTTEPRSVTLTTTSGQAAVTAAAGTFNKADVGRAVTGTGVPAGATLSAVASDTAATLSANATATGSRSVVIGVEGSVLAPSQYGFRGWSPESDAESATYTVAANNAATATPDKLADTVTRASERGRG